MLKGFKNHKGLGDTVEAVTRVTGIKGVVDFAAKKAKKIVDVKSRKKTLNELFPYGNKK